VLEVNGLSDMSVRIDLQRKHSRAPFHAATMAWWRKSPEELVMVIRERNRSKVGRMARLKGAAAIAPAGHFPLAAWGKWTSDVSNQRLEQLSWQQKV
jgi:hypothetical protein